MREVLNSRIALNFFGTAQMAATIESFNFNEAANKLIGLVRYASGALPDNVSILLARKT
jgi:hypothetical protein